MRGTIRFRITAIAVLAAALLLGAVSLVMVIVLRVQLVSNLDGALEHRADTIAAVLADTTTPELGHEEDLVVQVVDGSGVVSSATDNLADAGPIAPAVPGTRTVHGIAGLPETFRVLTRRVDTAAGPVVVHVGSNVDEVNDPVSIMTRLLAISVPAVVALLGLLTWWLTGRTLRPVEEMRTELASISATELGRRVPEPATGDEIDRLARTINGTLDRLEDAVRRQHRFVADASHELRGPLTRIRGELEVDLAQPQHADHSATHRSVLDDTIELQDLVDDLLHLARSDAGAAVSTPVPVDLDDVVLREARRLTDRGRVSVDAGAVSAACVIGDAAQLTRALRNLLDNAERHASSTVTIALDERDGRAQLVVADDGPGIPAEQRQLVFERFARLDDARTRDAGGSGLGLAITRDIVERHGGNVRLANGDGARFVVDLPSAPSTR